MSITQVRTSHDPETCAVCGRRLLKGERINWYVAPDASRRPVCELCAPRAERARWVREREGEEIVPLLPSRAVRGSFFKRLSNFFGAQEEDELQLETFDASADARSDQETRRKTRATRRRKRTETLLPPPRAAEPRSVMAVPTGLAAKLQQGLSLFNESQFPRTIAGLSRSLGDPQVAAVNDSDASVEVFVGWDIAWYSYRVDLGDATEPVEQSGRGNDTAELAGTVADWNVWADEYGRLYLREPGDAPEPADPAEPTEPAGTDGPAVYGGGA